MLQDAHVRISTVCEAIVRAGKCKILKFGADKFAFSFRKPISGTCTVYLNIVSYTSLSCIKFFGIKKRQQQQLSNVDRYNEELWVKY